MNKKLEDAIRKFEFDPGKKHLIVLNHDQFSMDSGVTAVKYLEKEGYPKTMVMFVEGDVRTAAELYSLDDIKGGE